MAGSNAEFNEDRLASIVRSVYTALQGDTSVTAERFSNQTSVEDELRSRFQTPRGPVTSGSSLHAAPSTSRSSSTDRVRYNPRANYGYTGKGKGKGKGKSGKAKEPVQLPTKELILLPSPGYNKVPRFERKRKLQELGLIIDGFPFDKTWDETQLQTKVPDSSTIQFFCKC